MGWVYLEIAKGLDWNYKIITVDDFMLAGWLSPLFGALLQGIILLKKRRDNKYWLTDTFEQLVRGDVIIEEK